MRTETIDHRRRQLLGAAALHAAAQFGAAVRAQRPERSTSAGATFSGPLQAGRRRRAAASAMPKPGPQTAQPLSCCTAGPMTSTAMPRSRRCSQRQDIG